MTSDEIVDGLVGELYIKRKIQERRKSEQTIETNFHNVIEDIQGQCMTNLFD